MKELISGKLIIYILNDLSVSFGILLVSNNFRDIHNDNLV